MYGSSSIIGTDFPDLSDGSFSGFSDVPSGSDEAMAQPIVDPDPLAGLEIKNSKILSKSTKVRNNFKTLKMEK